MYIYYLTVIRKNGAKGVPSCRDMREFFLGANDKAISGPGVAAAVLVLFSAAVMTLSKTVLYCELFPFLGFHTWVLGVCHDVKADSLASNRAH